MNVYFCASLAGFEAADIFGFRELEFLLSIPLLVYAILLLLFFAFLFPKMVPIFVASKFSIIAHFSTSSIGSILYLESASVWNRVEIS